MTESPEQTSTSTSTTNTSTSTPSEPKCPVDHKAGASSLWKALGFPHPEKSEPALSPQDLELQRRNLPASLEEAAKHAQTPHADQRLPLSTHRVHSSIPRGGGGGGGGNGAPADGNVSTPHHQPSMDEASTWVYPSEQQVFNAMKRKGWQGVEEESIPSFLQVHNSVNERSWRQLCEWEGGINNSGKDIKLVKFEGRPADLTPKAWIWTNLLFQEKPFDRHDWYIDNGVEHNKRYVLDFYMKEDARSGLPKVEIDVRPAIDTPSALVARVQRVAMDLFPGITKELQKMQSNRNATASGKS